MRIGVVILPETPWARAASNWRLAEDLGLDHAWTYDHLAWRELRDSPWFGAVPTLTAAATVTTKIRLGTLVSSANFRHPVPFAKEIITLDDVSSGRLTIGIGAGTTQWDASMLGQVPWTLAERTARFAEFVRLLDELLRSPETTSRGRFYSADEARTYPGCVQAPRVPFAVAASGPKGMRLAAGFGQTWVTAGDGSRERSLGAEEGAALVREQCARLDEACADVGRDPSSISRIVVTGGRLSSGMGSAGEFEETLSRYAEVGMTDLVVHWPRPQDPYKGDLGRFETILANRT
ncbi:MAG TPA: LLM class flavin-dependent oxidoreductase [Actinomycetota bacterium]|nr:LLM class flavin-dependent oxidoreductase [Actinomycetota bacterium]